MSNARIAALAKHLELTNNDDIADITVSSYDEKTLEYDKEDYLVVTDEEANELWEEDLENYIDDCLFPELRNTPLKDTIERYFDREAWKRDARMDGRGHSLGRYDGNEEEQEIDGTIYYIYRQN